MDVKSFFNKYPWVMHIFIMIGIALVILALVFLFIKIYARQGEEYLLPDMVGQHMEDAKVQNDIDLEFVVMDSIYRPGEEGGIILTQDPLGGTMVKRGRKVYITMTAFDVENTAVPELAGLTVRQAVSELTMNGFEVGRLTFVEDPYKNNIVGQTCKGRSIYAGQQLPRGSAIDLVVGNGDGSGASVVPFVIGKTRDRARRDILTASLNVGREHFSGVKDRRTAVVNKIEPDYTGVTRYPYGTEVELWFIDADQVDIKRMVSEFKVDSGKIDINISDGRPTPDEIEESEGFIW